MSILPLQIKSKPRPAKDINMPASPLSDEVEDPSIDDWKVALSNYELALRTIRPSQNLSVLRRLDTMVYTFLPVIISSRTPHHITANEYIILVEWKLRRGKWRRETLRFARMERDDEVKKASTRAFKQLEQGNLGAAFDALLPLLGSSPSVSSAILSVRDKSVPFMSLEMVQAVNRQNVNYFRSTFLKIVEVVRATARSLSRRDKNRTWTSVDVERAVYAQAHLPSVILEEPPSVSLGNHLTTEDAPQCTRAGRQHMDSGTDRGGDVAKSSRGKRRKISFGSQIEVLTGPVNMDAEQESDEKDDDLNDSLYALKSDYSGENDEMDLDDGEKNDSEKSAAEKNEGEKNGSEKGNGHQRRVSVDNNNDADSDGYGSVLGL